MSEVAYAPGMDRPKVWGPRGKPTCPTPSEMERERVRFRILAEQLEENLPDAELGWCWYRPRGGRSKIQKRFATAEDILVVKNWLDGTKAIG